ncbi:MAG: MBL fold metallo-hydrolase [Nostocaceae cyanobacterium]|nr:MBL fold metallo-hydrolase [Nostocaceae cyanobacterium]
MAGKEVYLKENVVLEPLFNQWYAWSYLISPATAAMYIASSHLKIMQSFVSAPQVHITTLKNPKMLGGPFINYGAGKVDEIKALMEKTKEQQAHMLELASAIKSLNAMLLDEATGYSIEELYQDVPEILKGYVELVYDLNNHPSFRLIEGLLYKSPYYNESSQSFAMSLIDKEEKRSFAFSTPRLKSDDTLHINIPFRSEAIDDLFRMKRTANSLGDIAGKLGIGDEDEQLFSSFFTEEKPEDYQQYTDDDVRIRYFGHACLLIESKDVSILCDPIISYKHDSEISRYTYSDLPSKIDYVLITHNHQDHCLFETLLQLRHQVENIVIPKNNGGSLADPSLKLMLKKLGFKKVIELDEIEDIQIPGGTITGLPFLGEHADLNIRTKIAYLVNIKGNSMVIAADSNNIENKIYQHIYNYFGGIDFLFLGMECEGAPLSWLYGSLLTKQLPRKMDQSRRFDGSNCEKAMKIVEQLSPKQVYVYAMGLEPWLTYITSIHYDEKSSPIVESNKLIAECSNHGVKAERLFGQKEMILK